MKAAANTSQPMDWGRLIDSRRHGVDEQPALKGASAAPQGEMRSDFRRDYDRLVFSSPFRRLQNKTQVFPLPGSIFVHNRLTHSLEVACVGQSLASGVAARLRMKHGLQPWTQKLDSLGDITAAACLAHDLGNPPFGHTGERTIAAWFTEGAGSGLRDEMTPAQWADLTHFDGNANAFRLLAHPFAGRRPGGFAMTYSTMASIVKYPFESLAATSLKFGFFTSEKAAFERIADTLGMLRLNAPGEPLRYARHPLVYLVEAADDICYEVMDLEDARKLGIVDTDTVITLFLGFFDGERRGLLRADLERLDDPNEKVAHLRSAVIDRLVRACISVFIDNEQAIMEGRFTSTLVKSLPSREREAYAAADAVSWDKIYRSPDVVDIELAGNHIISFLLDKLVTAVRFPDLYYSRLLLEKVPKQYDVAGPGMFERVQGVIDHVTGMTDVYALDLYRKLNAMSLKINN